MPQTVNVSLILQRAAALAAAGAASHVPETVFAVIYIYTCICMHIYIYIYTNIHFHVYICITHTYIYTYQYRSHLTAHASKAVEFRRGISAFPTGG